MIKSLREFIAEMYYDTIELDWDGSIKFHIYKNPTHSEVMSSFDKLNKEPIKGLIDTASHDLYVFDLDVDHSKSNRVIKLDVAIPIYINVIRKTVNVSTWNLSSLSQRKYFSNEADINLVIARYLNNNRNLSNLLGFGPIKFGAH